MRLSHGLSLGTVVLGVFLAAGSSGTAHPVAVGCAVPRASAAYVAKIQSAVRSGRDVLGERVEATPGGPSYGAARMLAPLWFARGRGGGFLTRSGAYYLALGFPGSLYGEKSFGLHVADGSEIITRRIGGAALRVVVGTKPEPYGTCLQRLRPPQLLDGYLPVLVTTYVDGAGVRYRQESFVAPVPGSSATASFVELRVDPGAAAGTTVRFRPTPAGLIRRDNTLVAPDGVRLAFSPGGSWQGSSLAYRVTRPTTIDVAWVHQPRPTLIVQATPDVFSAARSMVRTAWADQLEHASRFSVPDRRVMAAERNLLVQEILHTWRYSIGNPYEELSFVEALDVAQVMAEFGRPDVSRAIVRFALRRLPERTTSWRDGATLLAVGRVFALDRDPMLVDEATPGLLPALERLGAQIQRPGGRGLLVSERYSTDVGRRVIGFHQQATAWAGLRAVSAAWRAVGRPRLADHAEALARRLGGALREAVRRSRRELSDGTIFVPAALLEDEVPHERLSDSRDGSYWNLVQPYGLATGLLPPRGRVAAGILRYMTDHGAWLLGLVRARADTLYRATPGPRSGIDEVYGLALARFLADAGRAPQLGLALYGALANAMTTNTFVSGEAATVTPLAGAWPRTMFLPPNGGANAAFLETLRQMLVHERAAGDSHSGLELAFGTPRWWLSDGRRIAVERAATRLGPVSFALRRRGRRVLVDVDAPQAPRVWLRLRLPGQLRVVSVRDAHGHRLPLDPSTGTVELSHMPRHVRLTATVR